MIKTTLQIRGMMCGMCETHINEIIRNTFAVKKVQSSHLKGETVVISGKPLDKAAIEKAIKATGYELISCTETPYEERSILSQLKRKG